MCLLFAVGSTSNAQLKNSGNLTDFTSGLVKNLSKQEKQGNTTKTGIFSFYYIFIEAY